MVDITQNDERVAPNGISIKDLKDVSAQFHTFAGTSSNFPSTQHSGIPNLSAEVAERLELFTKSLSKAMALNLSGEDPEQALTQMRIADRISSGLRHDPTLRISNRDQVIRYLDGVVHKSPSGDLSETLKLTTILHGHALNNTYNGEEPVAKAPPPKDDQPVLGLGGS